MNFKWFIYMCNIYCSKVFIIKWFIIIIGYNILRFYLLRYIRILILFEIFIGLILFNMFWGNFICF